jgi:hypothetical protein
VSDSKSLAFLTARSKITFEKTLLIHENECVINLRVEVIEEKNIKVGMDKMKKKGHNFSNIRYKIYLSIEFTGYFPTQIHILHPTM